MDKAEFYVSVDIETDGPLQGIHSLRSIGAVAYNAELSQVGQFSINIEQHGICDPDTMKFWRANQSAWDALLANPIPPTKAMVLFGEWLGYYTPGPRRFIAAPTWFDYGWVRWYFLRYLNHDPFSMSVSDYRQQAWAAGIKVPKIKNPTPHVALADALEQGEQFAHVMRRIRARDDHAALIAKVRKVAETVEHSPDCDWLHDKDLGLFGKEMENEVCTCPRGNLLALCDSARGGEHG